MLMPRENSTKITIPPTFLDQRKGCHHPPYAGFTATLTEKRIASFHEREVLITKHHLKLYECERITVGKQCCSAIPHLWCALKRVIHHKEGDRVHDNPQHQEEMGSSRKNFFPLDGHLLQHERAGKFRQRKIKARSLDFGEISPVRQWPINTVFWPIIWSDSEFDTRFPIGISSGTHLRSASPSFSASPPSVRSVKIPCINHGRCKLTSTGVSSQLEAICLENLPALARLELPSDADADAAARIHRFHGRPVLPSAGLRNRPWTPAAALAGVDELTSGLGLGLGRGRAAGVAGGGFGGRPEVGGGEHGDPRGGGAVLRTRFCWA